MTRSALTTLCLGALLSAVPQMGLAQSGDLSPVLLVESGPSDLPDYRRMVFTKFLSGNQVSVNYKNYNRAEFIQVPNTTPNDIVNTCANGPASTLRDIEAFEREEKARERRGEPPAITRFCIKNVQNWEGGNRNRYLDPIFNGMPYAANTN